ncbi:anaerobic C4-dicarboxylate transporter [Marinilabiliaceae bacterium JC017]|nr:anaerobic C4-dicarboxylate transporter [Marinilabiliaceae bacterium JC017]
MIWIELAIVLGCIVVGARLGGIGLGTMAGIGLVILVFIFGLPPGSPPAVVLGMIIAVITALSAMQTAGGLDYMVMLAERAMKRKPEWITFVAPAVTYLFTLGAGTQHVVYALLPIIAEVSRKAGIRPERPLSASVIASQRAITASPISAATVAMVGMLVGSEYNLTDVLIICLPATFLSSMAGALSVAWKGKALSEDPVYLEKLEKGDLEEAKEALKMSAKDEKRAMGAALTFLLAIVVVVALGIYPRLRPEYEMVVGDTIKTAQLTMGQAIMIIMIAVGGLIMLLFKASPLKAMKGSVMRAGITAVISILGISWMGSSFFEGNRVMIIEAISNTIQSYPWVFAIGLFTLSILLFSQAATVVTLMPVGIALGLPLPLLIALFPATNGAFFLPTYGTILAAISFDRTGTTKIGKYLLNHSFMLPGLVATVVSIVISLAIVGVFY